MIKWFKRIVQLYREYRLPIDPEYIREKVQDSMAWSFASYDFFDLIDDTDLSSKEIEWAKNNLTWGVKILKI